MEDVKRKYWLKLLGFSSEKFVPKQANICSNHFKTNDLQITSKGRFLTPFAQLLPFHSFPDEIHFDDVRTGLDVQNVASTSRDVGQETKCQLM